MFTTIPDTDNRYAITPRGLVRDNASGQYIVPATDSKGDRFVRIEIKGKAQKRLVETLLSRTFASENEAPQV